MNNQKEKENYIKNIKIGAVLCLIGLLMFSAVGYYSEQSMYTAPSSEAILVNGVLHFVVINIAMIVGFIGWCIMAGDPGVEGMSYDGYCSKKFGHWFFNTTVVLGSTLPIVFLKFGSWIYFV